jgi:predicted MFS family arabinose efflux permease
VPIDRLGPRKTLIIANLLGVADALALSQADSYGQIIILALPLGLIEALATSSLDALPPRMVDDADLVSANALLGSAQNVAIIVGPLVAAAVNVHWGLEGAFLADAATFVVGIAVALPLKIEPVESEPQSARAELRDGISLARRTPGLRWTFRVATITYLLWGFAGILEPLYVRDVLGESDNTFALLQTVFGVGLVSAELVLARIGDRMARPRYVAMATIFSGATASIYLGTDFLVVAYVGVFLWGVDIAFFFSPAKTLLQRYAPMHAHGRIMSLNQAAEPLGSVIAAPVAAVAVGIVGVPAVAITAGAAAAGGGLIALRTSRDLADPPDRAIPPGPDHSLDAVAHGGPAPL